MHWKIINNLKFKRRTRNCEHDPLIEIYKHMKYLFWWVSAKVLSSIFTLHNVISYLFVTFWVDQFRILKIGPQGAKLDISMFFIKCALLGDLWGFQSPNRRLYAICGHIQAVCVPLSTFICRELDITWTVFKKIWT